MWIVIGGGNVAIDVARTSQRCGAGSVQMYCLKAEKASGFFRRNSRSRRRGNPD